MGTIYRKKHRKKDGTVVEGKNWMIKYYCRGKPIVESSRSTKKMVAKALLDRREGEIAEGRTPGIRFDKVTFDELANDFLSDYRVNKRKSYQRAEITVRVHLAPFFQGMRATEITTSKIKQHIERRMEAGAANASINRELAALKRMFSLATKSTPPKVAQIPYIPMLKENNVRKGFLEHHEFIALRGALPDYLKAPVTFAYHVGWRKGEIMGLTWDRVDLKQGIVRLEVGETKNSEARTVYLGPELIALFKQQMTERHLGCSYVFHRRGKPVWDFRDSWKKACKAAGIPDMLFHDLRRTAVRNMVRAGTPERVAMTISGHKTRTVFDRYNIVSLEDLRQAAERREKYLNELTVTNSVTNEQNNKNSQSNERGQVIDFI